MSFLSAARLSLLPVRLSSYPTGEREQNLPHQTLIVSSNTGSVTYLCFLFFIDIVNSWSCHWEASVAALENFGMGLEGEGRTGLKSLQCRNRLYCKSPLDCIGCTFNTLGGGGWRVYSFLSIHARTDWKIISWLLFRLKDDCVGTKTCLTFWVETSFNKRSTIY